jgi:hypothetical protein
VSSVSQFASPGSTREVDLGACKCPGTPHERDVATVREELGYAAYGYILDAPGPGSRTRRLVEVALVDWNLLGPDSQKVDASREAIALLKPAAASKLAAGCAFLLEDPEEDPLPNPSGADSPPTS